jgi:protocatechuate 3,4-dioxygenase beta subunit
MPQRDPTQPNMRRIPVGTAMISGTVTMADTGQPVRNARVMLNGSTRPPDSTAASAAATAPIGRGGVPMAMTIGTMSFSRSVLTDAQGHFSFPRLPAGQFNLSASRSQFLGATYGQRRPNGQGTAIQLADGQQMRTTLRMMRGGVVTGTVTGSEGDPQPFAQVRAWRYVMTNGFRRLQQTGGSSTDDRGIYRLYGLQPGDYLVSATPTNADLMNERMMADSNAIEQAIVSGKVKPGTAPGQPPFVEVHVTARPMMPNEGPAGFLQTYYGGTLVPSQATMITVVGNDERPGVDIQVLQVPAAMVHGSVITQLPQGVAVQVALLSEDPVTGGNTMSTRINADGRFTFRGVAPGRYTVLAQTVAAPRPPMQFAPGMPPPTPAPPPVLADTERLWGKTEISVDGPSPQSVSLALQPGKSISGIVQFEMERPPDLTRARTMVTLGVAPAPQTMSVGPAPTAAIGPDGRFTLNGIMPGRYILRASGGLMKSSIVNGQDTLDFPLEFTGERDLGGAVITVTDRASELSGVITDGAGKPAVDFTIVVAPSDPRFWVPGGRRILITRPDTGGRYTFRSLPPGDYMVAAVTDMEQGGQFDPEFLKAIAGASVRVIVHESAKVSQDLRVGG